MLSKKLTYSIKWLFWFLLITGPFLWIALVYDASTLKFLARFNSERLAWWMKDFPMAILGLWPLWLVVAVVGTAWKLGFLPKQETLSQPFSWAGSRYNEASKPSKIVLWMGVVPIFTWIICSQLSDQQRSWGVFIGIYILLATGLNLTVGMTGLLVIGYAAFYSIGAYTYAILNQSFAVPFWIAFIPAALVSGIVGLLIGLPSIRLRGDYLAIVTLGFGEVLRILLKNLKPFTGGDEGLFMSRSVMFPKFDSLPLFPGGVSREATGLFVMVALVILSTWAVQNLVHSRIGRAWIAIREDETAASAMGIPTFKMKLLAFSLSAAWAGVAGVCFAAYQGHIVPDAFGFTESIFILSMVILGGMGTVSGPIFGAAVFYLGYELLRSKFPGLTDYRLMIFGILMVILMIQRPQGLLGSKQRKVELGLES
jgi:branched-chain amino acid transport system permease protein